MVDENEGYGSEEDTAAAKEKSTIDTINDEDEKIFDFLGGEKPEPFFFGIKKKP